MQCSIPADIFSFVCLVSFAVETIAGTSNSGPV